MLRAAEHRGERAQGSELCDPFDRVDVRGPRTEGSGGARHVPVSRRARAAALRSTKLSLEGFADRAAVAGCISLGEAAELALTAAFHSSATALALRARLASMMATSALPDAI